MKLKLSELKKLEGNPRTIKKEDLDKLTKSIEKFGVIEGRPFLVSNRTGENIIIGGNQRYEVCKKLGIKEVPVHIMEGLSEEEEKEIIIRDNISNGEWDWDILANEWDKEELEEWGLDVQFETVEPEAEEDDFEVDEGIQTDIVLGDLFEIGPHRLLCGDSCNIDDVNKLMNGEKADSLITDPPYGYKYKSNRGANHEELKNDDIILDFLPNSLIYVNGFIFVFCAWKNIEDWIVYFKKHYELNNLIVWNKGGGGIGDLKKTFSTDYELCMVSHNGNEIKGKRNGSVWDFGKDSEIKTTGGHPTPKPISLIAEMVMQSTKEEDLILDLFGGSGSTMVACHQLNRKCFMSELDPKYVQTIINRMIKLDSTLEIKRNGMPYEISAITE